uniref:Uncharacterized protein n=1 Tax=Cryptosporidium parvum TaxID=5807 RepID=F0X552_CRYPV
MICIVCSFIDEFFESSSWKMIGSSIRIRL